MKTIFNRIVNSNILLLVICTLIAVTFSELWIYLQLNIFWQEKENHKMVYYIGFWTSSTVAFFVVGFVILIRTNYEKKLHYLNENLEKKVKEEVEKNRVKDKQLLQQSRMAQMGEMLSMIAHQWRQPLAAISATSASIELKASLNKLDNDEAQKKAHDISSFSQHLSRTIDDFRDFFKPNKEKKEMTYDEIVKSVLRIMEVSIANKNIQLLQDLNCHETFNTYPNELKQVVLNLIKNAEEALLEKAVKDPTITIATYTKEDTYILEVSDNAGGIPKDIINKIFDPYFSTKTKKDGTGLGLYMSKIIIEEHCDGTLSAINTGNGALFKIVLNKTND